MTYKEFEQEFSKHHICGIPVVPYDLAYDSHCPMCEPDERWGWKAECRKFYDEGRTVRFQHYWYTQEQIDKWRKGNEPKTVRAS